MPKEIAFTQEIQDKICELLAEMPMYKLTQRDDMPSNSTVMKWYGLYPEFHERCRRVRDLQADAAIEEQARVTNDMLMGLIEPEVARVALNAIQWRIMQLDKARYGDKPSKLTITNNTDNRRVDVTFETLKLAAPSALNDLKRQITAAHENEELTPN